MRLIVYIKRALAFYRRYINLYGHAMRPFLKDILYLVASTA